MSIRQVNTPENFPAIFAKSAFYIPAFIPL